MARFFSICAFFHLHLGAGADFYQFDLFNNYRTTSSDINLSYLFIFNNSIKESL